MSSKQSVESTADHRIPTFSSLLHPVKVRQLADDWLAEDVPAFDYGGFVVGEKTETAVLLCKSPGVLAGPLSSLHYIKNRKSHWIVMRLIIIDLPAATIMWPISRLCPAR